MKLSISYGSNSAASVTNVDKNLAMRQQMSSAASSTYKDKAPIRSTSTMIGSVSVDALFADFLLMGTMSNETIRYERVTLKANA